MDSVILADDRPAWIRKEDKVMACMTRCYLYKKCSSHFGSDCKKLGGSEIPSLAMGRRGKKIEKQKQTKKKTK